MGSYLKALAAKQSNTSLTNAPLHTTSLDSATALITRLDVLANFVTTLTANQPAALAVDTVRAYSNGDQYAEVEGRALPVAAYLHSWLQYVLYKKKKTPGFDKALVNNTQGFAYYDAIGFAGAKESILAEDSMSAQPYAGTGGLTSYSANDGTAGNDDDPDSLAPYVVARSFGSTISSLTVRRARAFLVAGAADFNTNFVIKAGGSPYLTEQINDIEDRLNDLLGTTSMSITGAASAGVRAARGMAQDPFTGAALYLMGDVYSEPQDVQIVLKAANAVQIAVLTDFGIAALQS